MQPTIGSVTPSALVRRLHSHTRLLLLHQADKHRKQAGNHRIRNTAAEKQGKSPRRKNAPQVEFTS